MDVIVEDGEVPKTKEQDLGVDYCPEESPTTHHNDMDLKENSTDTDLSDFKSLIVRKCSTGLELPPKVNLYSENIVKEEETTEHVDRGSIADLAAIKKHWEHRFESVESEKGPERKTQRVVRHWSVKLADIPGRAGGKQRGERPTPDAVNRNQEENMTEFKDDYNENESAIEREIRWAMEREEMLHQEQELRLLKREKLMELEQLQREQEEEGERERNNGVQTQQIIKHYEKTDQEKFKPTYHEMTEADLGHEMAKKKELEMRKDHAGNEMIEPKGDKMSPTPTQYRETVVQMEIRLQSERDAQFKEQLKLLNKSENSETEHSPKTTTGPNEAIVDDNANLSLHPAPDQGPLRSPAPKTQAGSASTTSYRHVGESKIARELEEGKAREEEFRQRLKDLEKRNTVMETENIIGHNGNGNKDLEKRNTVTKTENIIGHNGNKNLEKRNPGTKTENVIGHNGNGNGSSRRDSVDDLEGSVASLDLGQSAAASSESDISPAPSSSSSSSKVTGSPNETPIEREIRFAREREEELRRQKGYPSSEKPGSAQQRSVDAKSDAARKYKYKYNTRNNNNKPAKKGDEDAMKKIAASRLQQEMRQERSREVTLRESGRISTTSDERVGEQRKYKEVSEGGPVKRNFVTVRKNSVTTEDPSAPDSHRHSADPEGSATGEGGNPQKRNVPNYVIKTPKVSTIFSFREAKSNAGSMIEQELKEMRQREEELKKQREETVQNQANNNNNNNNSENND